MSIELVLAMFGRLKSEHFKSLNILQDRIRRKDWDLKSAKYYLEFVYKPEADITPLPSFHIPARTEGEQRADFINDRERFIESFGFTPDTPIEFVIEAWSKELDRLRAELEELKTWNH